MKKGLLLVLFLYFYQCAIAQKDLLQSGPMLGYSTMKEVLLWVQTKSSAKVHFKYFEKGKSNQKRQTKTIITQKENAFVAKIVVETLPSKVYEYELYINDKLVGLPYKLEFQSQTLWQWRSDPPAFKFAFGSCAYISEEAYDRPGKPYGGSYFIFDEILKKKPDFMIWGGDNMYLREVDWDSRTGILDRYTHTRSNAEMQALLASVHHYATWDDHDFGPDNSDRSFWNKAFTTEAFKLFWGNPNYIFKDEGITGTFFWQDVQFFLMDNRYFRSPNNAEVNEDDFLGQKQVKWLIDALKFSRAPFKFVVIGGQVLNNNQKFWSENYGKYPKELQQLLEGIKKNKVRGVIFLTGDRHHSELSKMDRENTYPLYDLTVSPLTAGATGDRTKSENNFYRVPDTHYGERNFSILEVSGPRTDRKLSIQIFSNKGEEIWKKEIKAQELK